jgi:hypothetical protein
MPKLLRKDVRRNKHSTIGNRKVADIFFKYDILQNMQIKNIYVFGNPDIEIDSLPIKLLPKLRAKFPKITFKVLDPNEEWDVDKNMIIIDTVIGIKDVTVFSDLSSFMKVPRMTCHDFDAYSNLMFMTKLKKINSVKIIGIPVGIKQDILLQKIQKIINKILTES